MAHKALARLRGRAEPREDILDRLLVINPRFRVGWVPPGIVTDKGQRPAFWRIYEEQPHQYRRAVGYSVLHRYEKWPNDKKAQNPGIVYEAEEKIDGLHVVAEYIEDYFGTDKMFEELKESERNLNEHREAVRKAQDDQADADVTEEMGQSDEFREYVREVAGDYYRSVSGNPMVSVTRNIT